MAACSDGDSFYADVTVDYEDSTEMSGCYLAIGSFTSYADVNYFLDGTDGEGRPFFMATSSPGDENDGDDDEDEDEEDDDDDDAIWVLSHFNLANDTFTARCVDADENDALTIHPTEVALWNCRLEGTSEFTLEDRVTTTCSSSCNATTPLSASSDGDGGATSVMIVIGVVVAGALAALVLGFFLWRRRAVKATDVDQTNTRLPDRVENLDRGDEYNQQIKSNSPTCPSVAERSEGGVPSDRQTTPPPPYLLEVPRIPPSPPYQGSGVEGAVKNIHSDDCKNTQELPLVPPMGAEEPQTKQGAHLNMDGGRTPAGVGTNGSSSVQRVLSAAKDSTAEISTAETTELSSLGMSAEYDCLPLPEGSKAIHRKMSGGVGYGQAAMAAAQELAQHCQIPGVSEAATMVSILIDLVCNSRDMSQGNARIKRCRSIVMMLERAAKVLDKGNDTAGEVERSLMEDVHDAVSDLVELIQTYQSKNKLSKVFLSTLFKRRQDELDAVIDRAILRLHLVLQVQVGHDVKEGLHLHKGSATKSTPESLVEARRVRRQRNLDQVEIPEGHVVITEELLGKGGFGDVYLADYNGRNAAAKVHHLTHCFDEPGESDDLHGSRKGESNAEKEKSQRRAFLRELDAMVRLRSPHTVNVYGAITSVPNRLILVMELLAGGDLRNMLKNSDHPLPEKRSRQIIGDICAGMSFLHSKGTVHGDLKSANVLLDAGGRAKIGDFGASRWAENTSTSTGLATYSKTGPSTHISFAWTAPEVLETKGASSASDVYSFGVVVWEVLSRKIPWAEQVFPRDVYVRVVVRGERLAIPKDTPVDISEMMLGCWAQAPEDRPTFQALMDGGMSAPQ